MCVFEESSQHFVNESRFAINSQQCPSVLLLTSSMHMDEALNLLSGGMNRP